MIRHSKPKRYGMMTAKAKVLEDESGQTVLLPPGLVIPGTTARIRRIGKKLAIMPVIEARPAKREPRIVRRRKP